MKKLIKKLMFWRKPTIPVMPGHPQVRLLLPHEVIKSTDGQYIKTWDPAIHLMDSNCALSINPSSDHVGKTVAQVQPYGNNFYRQV